MKSVLSFIVLSIVSFQIYAQDIPTSAQVTQVQFDGSGCDAGSANAIITEDLSFLSVLYDRFSAEIGNGTANKKSKSIEKRCSIIVNVNVPQGWVFDFEQIDYRGFIEIPNKASVAYQLTTAEIEGGAAMGFDQQLFQGPRNENYMVSVKNKAPKILNKVSCLASGQNIKIRIKTTVGVRNLLAGIMKPAVKIIVDSTDASFRQNLKLRWKRCI